MQGRNLTALVPGGGSAFPPPPPRPSPPPAALEDSIFGSDMLQLLRRTKREPEREKNEQYMTPRLHHILHLGAVRRVLSRSVPSVHRETPLGCAAYCHDRISSICPFARVSCTPASRLCVVL